MKIISIRKGFQADHSSTSYEFFAVEKPLTTSEREEVSCLSSRARPTKRKVSFIYHGNKKIFASLRLCVNFPATSSCPALKTAPSKTDGKNSYPLKASPVHFVMHQVYPFFRL